eukprot:TRINITY_DN2707_c0_g1_i1.p1 TRINITY_DN2707_c0_g1~~TRINITY_DN2707_c0_g1_i1.p1  ORF type:complete len:298 (-),score=57.77 TRINITY_DN2707_c0_g1_i1:275-1168(-)
MVKVTVQSRSGRNLGTFDVLLSSTVKEFKKDFASKFPKYYPDRQRFTASDVALVDEKKLSEYSLKEGSVLIFKDLGPQISWRTVFLTEYGGPLLLYPIFYFFASAIYGKSATHHFVQDLALYCWTAHYLKRELETIFVHRFSHGTMPIFNIFKNSFYYWGCTALVSYFVNHPKYTPPQNETYIWIGLGVFILGELGNLICHVQLRNLRPEGTTTRAIPRGFMFEFVSCPNYFFEVTSWIGFTIMTHTFTAGVFTLLGFVQMYVWAVQKHRRYRSEFDGKEGRPSYPRGRKSIIPFLL